MPEVFEAAHNAFNRMRRAAQRGTGCHLTAEMIAALECTFLGEVWSLDDPRKLPQAKEIHHA